jgi:phosphate transport system permease protein
MSVATVPGKVNPPPDAPRMKAPSRLGDRMFEVLTLCMAFSVAVLICVVGFELWSGSRLSMKTFGWHFLVSSDWDPGNDDAYGALPFIYGTLVSSCIALVIAVPLSVAIISLIEMLAAIPSVILGLWGIFVMEPWMRVDIIPLLRHTLGWAPPFRGGATNGPCMLAGGMIIAIMIIPIITSVSREILVSVPDLQREAAYALGATRWEVTRIAVLSYAKRGIFGAVILGLGRALGETMAVAMVIGNTPQISASLFAYGATLASVIANEFAEASDLCVQSLFEIGLVLFGVTIIVNLLAQLILKTFSGATVKQ